MLVVLTRLNSSEIQALALLSARANSCLWGCSCDSITSRIRMQINGLIAGGKSRRLRCLFSWWIRLREHQTFRQGCASCCFLLTGAFACDMFRLPSASFPCRHGATAASSPLMADHRRVRRLEIRFWQHGSLARYTWAVAGTSNFGR